MRAGWRSARWFAADGKPAELPDLLRKAAERGLIDRPLWPEGAAAATRRRARRAARRERPPASQATLLAADGVILAPSLTPAAFAAAAGLAPYRLRGRSGLGFTRLKSGVGLKRSPGVDARSARPCVLARLLASLLLEPLVDELEDPPRWATAA